MRMGSAEEGVPLVLGGRVVGHARGVAYPTRPAGAPSRAAFGSAGRDRARQTAQAFRRRPTPRRPSGTARRYARSTPTIGPYGRASRQGGPPQDEELAPGENFVGKSGLAHSCLARDQDEPALATPNLGQDIRQRRELCFAADQLDLVGHRRSVWMPRTPGGRLPDSAPIEGIAALGSVTDPSHQPPALHDSEHVQRFGGDGEFGTLPSSR
jgi:hypothetical protein